MMDVTGVGFYLAIALIAHLLFRARPTWLAVALAMLCSAIAVGLLARISTHQFDFFSRQNISEMLAGNAGAAVLSVGVAWLMRLARR
jgi:hypothetical protein